MTGSTPETTNGNGASTPWGVASAILKKDGVIGLFLVALCYFIWADKKEDRIERERTAALQKEMFDSLAVSHRREGLVATQAIEALRIHSASIDNTRRALQYVERFHHRQDREN